jgi:hypothetical protein
VSGIDDNGKGLLVALPGHCGNSHEQQCKEEKKAYVAGYVSHKRANSVQVPAKNTGTENFLQKYSIYYKRQKREKIF